MNNKTNIILIVLDAFRKDYFITNNNITKLTDDGFIFYDNVISPSPWTPPSHASIFTGVYPAIHGTHIYRDKGWTNNKIKASAKNLFFTNILKLLGYRTYLFSANPYISPVFGYTDFDYTLNIDPYFKLIYRLKWEEERKLRELMLKYKFSKINVVRKIIKMHEYKFLLKSILYSLSKRHWDSDPLFRYLYYTIKKWPMEKGISEFINILKNMKFDRSSPYFLFMNLMEVHEPYVINDFFFRERMNILKGYELDYQYINFLKNKYRESSMYLINKLSELLDIFKQRKLFNNSLIIITSDHGQLLGEHGKLGHEIFLYDELLEVPLLIKYPSNLKVRSFKRDSNQYISLTRLKSLILQVIRNSISVADENILYTDTVFSETYGIEIIYSTDIYKKLNDKEKKTIENLDQYRIAIYYDNIKCVFNVNKWIFDEIFNDRNCDLNAKQLEVIKEKIKNFCYVE